RGQITPHDPATHAAQKAAPDARHEGAGDQPRQRHPSFQLHSSLQSYHSRVDLILLPPKRPVKHARDTLRLMTISPPHRPPADHSGSKPSRYSIPIAKSQFFRSYAVGRFGGQSPPKNPSLFLPSCGGFAATAG